MTLDTFNHKGYDIPVDLLEKTGGGTETFNTISEGHIEALKLHIGINATDNIVEIGCGIGRDAIPLTSMIGAKGNYLGTDVIRESVNWCASNITPRHPNFQFEWHDIRDDLHNPNGKLEARDIKLPRPDSSVDLIILQSVFTHMYENEIEHYLTEFHRILKPSGRVWASVFIVDSNILSHVNSNAKTQHQLTFKFPYGRDCYINSLESPRGAVAFTQAALDRMLQFSKNELVRQPLRGAWSETIADPEFGQDVLIIAKRRSAIDVAPPLRKRRWFGLF